MPRRENVLAIPSEAILIDHGYDVCFVVHEDSLERRQVKLGKTTRELVEVTAGPRGRRAGGPEPAAGRPGFRAGGKLVASSPSTEPPAIPASFTGSVAASH